MTALLFGVVGSLHAEQMSLTPVKDNTLIEDDINFSDGAGPALFIGTTASGGRRRALMKFDVANIPTAARITSASLRMSRD